MIERTEIVRYRNAKGEEVVDYLCTCGRIAVGRPADEQRCGKRGCARRSANPSQRVVHRPGPEPGTKFGDKTVVGGPYWEYHNARVVVRCECGHESVAVLTHLRAGKGVRGCRHCKRKYPIALWCLTADSPVANPRKDDIFSWKCSCGSEEGVVAKYSDVVEGKIKCCTRCEGSQGVEEGQVFDNWRVLKVEQVITGYPSLADIQCTACGSIYARAAKAFELARGRRASCPRCGAG